MATAFATPIDIANRACQHMGVRKIDTSQGFTEDTVQADEISTCYDGLRRAELRRNIWRFAIRNAALRAIDVNTLQVAPTLWASTTTYFPGTIVSLVDGSLWMSTAIDNLNNPPGNSSLWDSYFGPMTCDPWDMAIAYYAGEIVYVTGVLGAYTVYMSLVNGNTDNPATPDGWAIGTTYSSDQVISYNSTLYQSLLDVNVGNEPDTSPSAWTTTITNSSGSSQWSVLPVALQDLLFAYPIGTGPSSQAASRNVFRLPAGYLRPAPQNPKAGSVSFLGAPTGLMYTDWEYDGNYLLSQDAGPIIFRFVADLTNVTLMDDMFCEGLGARIGVECCERVTQSGSKLGQIALAYKTFMGDARTINGIENGPVEPPEDDFITCRI